MLALGIDPGIDLTGYGLVREDERGDLVMVAYGVVKTSSKQGVAGRLQQIYTELTALIGRFQPDTCAIEKLFFGRNVTTAIVVGQARGVSLLALANGGLDITEYTPAEIKQSVAGYGNAPKEQVQEMVRMLLGLDEIPRPDDAADALAIAIAHLHSSRYKTLYSG